jgi:hypothetical protein
MFISYPQYLFVASSYTNILNIYAFSNWHDVSWGSKRGKEVATNVLPSAKITKADDSAKVVEEIDQAQGDIDSNFEAVCRRALTPYVPANLTRPKKTLEESFAMFRTRLVAVYIFSNFFLCILVMNDSFDQLKFLVRKLFAICSLSWSKQYRRATHISTKYGSSASGCGELLAVSCYASWAVVSIWLGLSSIFASLGDNKIVWVFSSLRFAHIESGSLRANDISLSKLTVSDQLCSQYRLGVMRQTFRSHLFRSLLASAREGGWNAKFSSPFHSPAPAILPGLRRTVPRPLWLRFEVANPDPVVKAPLQSIERGVVGDAAPQVPSLVALGGISDQTSDPVVVEGVFKSEFMVRACKTIFRCGW